VEGPTERTGKARGADLMDGTVTLPLILARGEDPGLELRGVEADPARAALLCERIAATGALEEAREQALGYVGNAKAALDSLELPDARRQALDLVADAVVERYS
jgi:geranylgeranyl pyrophosphate synthase